MRSRSYNQDVARMMRYITDIPKTITNVSELYYCGLFVGSEFLTYAVTKIYVCERLTFHCSNFSPSSFSLDKFRSVVYNHANAIKLRTQNYYFYYDGTNLNAWTNDYHLNNLVFSRIVNGTNNEALTFNGYRITLA